MGFFDSGMAAPVSLEKKLNFFSLQCKRYSPHCSPGTPQSTKSWINFCIRKFHSEFYQVLSTLLNLWKKQVFHGNLSLFVLQPFYIFSKEFEVFCTFPSNFLNFAYKNIFSWKNIRILDNEFGFYYIQPFKKFIFASIVFIFL